MRRALPIVTLVPLLAGSPPLAAQEPAAATGESPFSGQAELSFVSTSGNTDTRTLGVAGEFQYVTDGWTLEAKTAYVSGSTDDELSARSVTTEARVAREISAQFEVFGRFDHVRNLFAGIRNRYAGEGGLGYRIGPSDARHRVRFVAGTGFTKELRVATPDRTFVSANYGARYRWRVSATADVAAEATLTHNLEVASDWRAASTVSITAQLTAALSMKLSHRLGYLHQPVPGFRKRDVVTSAAVVARF